MGLKRNFARGAGWGLAGWQGTLRNADTAGKECRTCRTCRTCTDPPSPEASEGRRHRALCRLCRRENKCSGLCVGCAAGKGYSTGLAPPQRSGGGRRSRLCTIGGSRARQGDSRPHRCGMFAACRSPFNISIYFGRAVSKSTPYQL